MLLKFVNRRSLIRIKQQKTPPPKRWCLRENRVPTAFSRVETQWLQTGSNRRLLPCRGSALPAELWSRDVVLYLPTVLIIANV